MRRLITLCAGAALWLLGSGCARAAGERDPLEIPLRQYGLVLGAALLGGLVSWIGRVRAGQTAAANLMGLVGELATSAFSGLIAFWLCEASGLSPLMTATAAGIAGHMGTRAILVLERELQRRAGIAPAGEQEVPRG